MSQTVGLREQIMNILLDERDTTMSFDQMTDAILAVIPDPRHGPGGNNPPEPITPEKRLAAVNPENLLVLAPQEIAPMLDLQYPLLVERAVELQAKGQTWLDAHTDAKGMVAIADDADTNMASDLFRLLRGHAGDTGEVDETRKKVKLAPFQACKIIDAWFANLRDQQKATMAAIDTAQAAYLRRKEADARRKADAEAETARQETARVAAAAQKQIDDAKKLADEAADAARASGDQDAIDRAIEAENVLTEVSQISSGLLAEVEAAEDVAARRATAPTPDMTRTRSVMGTTTSGSTTWDFEVTSMADLCRAVADGKASATFVTANDAAIRAAIRTKHAPLRECPGLTIAPTTKVRRSGS